MPTDSRPNTASSLLFLLLVILKSSSSSAFEWILRTTNWAASGQAVALERHEWRLLADKEHHPSMVVADNEMKRCARTILHKKCQSLVVIDCGHR